MQVADITKKLVNLSEKDGASQAEAYAVITQTMSVYIDDNIPKVLDRKEEFGVSLRYIKGKQIGLTSSTLLGETDSDIVSRASSIASVSNVDPKFVSLPDPKRSIVSIDKFYDKKTADAHSPLLVEKCSQLIDSCSDDYVSVPNGVLRVSTIHHNVVNSLGVDAGSKSTIVFGFFTAKSEMDGEVGEGVQRCWSRSLYDIDFGSIGAKLKAQAKNVIRAKSFAEKWEDIVAVLAPSEGSEMLGTLIGSACSAESVNRGSSPWTDKLGDVVADSKLSVIDNGLSERGLLSAAVDDEGTPMQTTPLIEKGVLKSYFFDSYNAGIQEMRPTGNGLRGNPRDAQGRFISAARCSPTTLEVVAGSKDFDEIVGEIDRGIFIEHFAYPQVNPMNGTFSNEIRNGRLIVNGELTDHVKNALAVGNLLGSLKKKIQLGSKLEVNSSYLMPLMAFSGVEIVGQ